MIFSGVALYFYTRALLQNEIEEELYSNKDRIEHLLLNDSTIKGVPPIMTVKKVSSSETETLKDTLLYDPFQNEEELFRQLSGTKNINGQEYRVTVRAMVIESEDILKAILVIFSIVILLAFLFLFVLNKSRNEKLWKPFFNNLEKLKNFSLKSDKPLDLMESDIKEFDDLNTEMTLLTSKVQTDYRNLKQFTEDISHEMQTPLAIMQAKIETFIDDQNITQEQFDQWSSLQNDIQRLKQLNKRLIILAKIDNNQFSDTECVSVNDLLQRVIADFSEIIETPINYFEDTQINIDIDRSLASVLFNNLISNAVKHKFDSTPIDIQVIANKVQVKNSGSKALSQPEMVFERFYKESNKPDSTGLGLSIVKKICDHYSFVPSYQFNEIKKQHIFEIDLQQ